VFPVDLDHQHDDHDDEDGTHGSKDSHYDGPDGGGVGCSEGGGVVFVGTCVSGSDDSSLVAACTSLPVTLALALSSLTVACTTVIATTLSATVWAQWAFHLF